jgi:hypothetical protein
MAAAYRPRPRRSEGCDRWVIDAPCPLVASHGASIRVMRQMGSRRRVARPPPPPPSSRRQQQQPQQPSPVPHVVRCHICCCCLSGNTPLPIDNIDRHHNVILSPPNAPCCTTRDNRLRSRQVVAPDAVPQLWQALAAAIDAVADAPLVRMHAGDLFRGASHFPLAAALYPLWYYACVDDTGDAHSAAAVCATHSTVAGPVVQVN